MNTPERLGSRLVTVVAWTVAAASGIFMLLYLYRWEWNRAMISGLFFVASELALATAAILRRIGRLERRVDDLEPVPVATSDAAPPENPAGGPFAWLEDVQGHGVFVPVLLGVGVIISGIAWAVERLASASWSFGGDVSAERRLRRLRPTQDGFVAVPADLAKGGAAMRWHPPPTPEPAARSAGRWPCSPPRCSPQRPCTGSPR